MQWFLELLDELAVECRVGDPAKIRAQETRQQTHDRRDACLLLKLLSEHRFPEIWMPSSEERDLRTLLRDRQRRDKLLALYDQLQKRIQELDKEVEAQGPTKSELTARIGRGPRSAELRSSHTVRSSPEHSCQNPAARWLQMEKGATSAYKPRSLLPRKGRAVAEYLTLPWRK